MVMDMNQVIKEKIMVTNLHKESNLLTEKKGLGVLGFDIMVLPLSMDNVILEHVCLQTKINQNVSYIAQHNFLLEIEGAFSDKGNHFRQCSFLYFKNQVSQQESYSSELKQTNTRKKS
jgi:hypothetical protein